MKKGERTLHPTTGNPVEIVDVFDYKKHRKIKFRAKGCHGHWIEYKKKEKA